MKKWMSFLICGVVIVMAASFSICAIGQELENPIPNSIYVYMLRYIMAQEISPHIK